MKAKVLTRTGVAEMDLTPLKAIRQKCLECCCWHQAEVQHCPVATCPHHPFRMGHGAGKSAAGVRPIEAIHAKCLDCSSDNPFEVRDCRIKHCAIYEYRLGKNPAHQGNSAISAAGLRWRFANSPSNSPQPVSLQPPGDSKDENRESQAGVSTPLATPIATSPVPLTGVRS